ncbi:MAG: hypothetical protein ACPG6B_00245 [Oceanihabitans sp.]
MRILLYITVLFFFFSCKEPSNSSEISIKQEQTNLPITKEDISKLSYSQFILDTKATKTIDSWQKYQELEGVVTKINNANFSFFINNNEIVLALVNELNETLPQGINTPLIRARLLTLKTKMLKLESETNLTKPAKKELLAVTKEFLVSFSNLNFQINKKFEKDSQKIEKPY